MPTVYNKHHKNAPVNAVYIGRGSPWGNPFVIGQDGDRATVIRKYEAEIRALPENITIIKQHLKGKDLVCFCKPQACHGDILLQIANE